MSYIICYNVHVKIIIIYSECYNLHTIYYTDSYRNRRHIKTKKKQRQLAQFYNLESASFVYSNMA